MVRSGDPNSPSSQSSTPCASHTARRRASFAAGTESTMRSCASLIQISHGDRPAYLSGASPSSTTVPRPSLISPTAELKPDQTDEASLGPYAQLDDILDCLVEKEMGIAAIVARGHDESYVRRVWRMLDLAEYKRRQAAPGVKISRRAFGRDRRYPSTNGFRAGGA